MTTARANDFATLPLSRSHAHGHALGMTDSSADVLMPRTRAIVVTRTARDQIPRTCPKRRLLNSTALSRIKSTTVTPWARKLIGRQPGQDARDGEGAARVRNDRRDQIRRHHGGNPPRPPKTGRPRQPGRTLSVPPSLRAAPRQTVWTGVRTVQTGLRPFSFEAYAMTLPGTGIPAAFRSPV